jgi:hypothetical protein
MIRSPRVEDFSHAEVDVSRDMPVVGLAISWPEPLKEAAFHGVIGDMVRLIEPHTEADPAAILIQSLVAFGNLIGRGSYFRVEADEHHRNLFALLVGETSKGRKGTSLSHVRRQFAAADELWEKGQIKSGLSSGEGLAFHVRDPLIQGEKLVDEGVSDKRLLVVESEFASVLRRMNREGNTLSTMLRDGWDTGDLRVLNKNSAVAATGAHISVNAHITKHELLREICSTDQANGFCNRFLFAMVRRSKKLPEGGQIETVDFAPIVERIRRSADSAKTACEIRRDDDAREIWRTVYPKLSEGLPGMLGAVTSRAEAQTVRLSMLYALADCSNVIRREHLLAALAVWDYCEISARYIFGDATGDPDVDTILAALRNSPQGLTRSDISSLLGRNKQAVEIARALAMIESMGLAKPNKEHTEGRSIERWTAVR